MSRHGFLALIVVFGASAVSAQTAPDATYCALLQDFVKSVRRGESEEVIFRTTWGRGFNDSPEQLYEKRCHHPDGEPSARLCGYLVKHGSAEFTGATVKAAIMCLSPETRLAPGLRLERGTFSFSVGTPDRGAWVEIAFGEDPDVGGKAFRLKTKGY